MKRIDFDKAKPDFVNEGFNWYIDEHFQDYIQTKQAFNLPKLKGLGCFIVKGEDVEDYVLIDNKQNIICAFPYTFEGYGSMEARINIIKISKHYDDYEKANV